MSVKTVAQPTQTEKPASKNRLITGEELYRMTHIGPAELVRGEIAYHMPAGHPHGFIENIIGSHERLAQAQAEGYLDVAPELVVEIMSPSNTWSEAQEKLAEYFAIDVKMVWVVDPQLEQIHVYRAPDRVKLLTLPDMLTGEDVSPGFQAALTDIFTAE